MDASDAGDTREDDVNSDVPGFALNQTAGGACMLRDGDESLSTLDDDDDDANATSPANHNHNNSSVQLEFDTTAASATTVFWDPATDLTQQVQNKLFTAKSPATNLSAQAAAAALYTAVCALVDQYATPVQAELWKHANVEQRHAWIVALPPSS